MPTAITCEATPQQAVEREVRTQSGRQRAEQTGKRIQFPSAEAEPGTTAEHQQRDRAKELGKIGRRHDQAQGAGDGRRRTRALVPEPIEILPQTSENGRHPVLLGHHCAKRAVIGKNDLAGKKAAEEQQGQTEAQNCQANQPLAHSTTFSTRNARTCHCCGKITERTCFPKS